MYSNGNNGQNYPGDEMGGNYWQAGFNQSIHPSYNQRHTQPQTMVGEPARSHPITVPQNQAWYRQANMEPTLPPPYKLLASPSSSQGSPPPTFDMPSGETYTSVDPSPPPTYDQYAFNSTRATRQLLPSRINQNRIRSFSAQPQGRGNSYTGGAILPFHISKNKHKLA